MSETAIPLFRVWNYSVEALDEEDGSLLQELIEGCADYWDLAYGVMPGPATALSIFTVLPEEKTGYDDKFVLGVREDSGRLVGFVDIIRDHPEDGEWTIGLFLLRPDVQGRGLGRALYQALAAWAEESGCKYMRVGVSDWNEVGLSFAQALGFEVIERKPDFRTYEKEGALIVLRNSVF